MQVLSTQGERTNDIARSVQNGDTDILVLWLACRSLVMQTARRWHRAFNGSRGVVLDDLEQVGFLALTKAAETWNPDSGAFSTWLTFQLKTAFAAAYFMRTERDRKDPLNDAVSLDTPPTGTDEDVKNPPQTAVLRTQELAALHIRRNTPQQTPIIIIDV